MPQNDYREQIQRHVTQNPGMMTLLVKVIRSFRAHNNSLPKQVTLGNLDELNRFDVSSLFSPEAIKPRGDKMIFFPEKMRNTGILVEDWFVAAASLTGNSLDKKQNDKMDLLLNKLNMLFPTLEASLYMLHDKRSAVKRKITEINFNGALEHYKTCLQAVDFLKKNDKLLSPSDLGIEICKDSKSFRGTPLFKQTCALLAVEFDVNQEDVMLRCGVSDNPTSVIVTIFGPFVYYRQGKKMNWIRELWNKHEAATLNFGNLEKIERIELESDEPLSVLSCENESPFNKLIRESENYALIYTAGFPNSAVKRFLSLLPSDISFFHWGDSDPEGLEIATILNKIKPLRLCRCDVDTCRRLKKNLKKLSRNKIKRAQKMLESPNFPFNEELEFTLQNGWLEQEAWITK